MKWKFHKLIIKQLVHPALFSNADNVWPTDLVDLVWGSVENALLAKKLLYFNPNIEESLTSHPNTCRKGQP